MSIFTREEERAMTGGAAGPGRAATHPTSSRATYIAKGTRITGEIRGQTELVVDGEMDGQLRLDDDVVVGAEGVVKGEILARSVRIGGKVMGNVRGRELVELQASGSIEGDVSAPRVVIADGAFFKGNVEMTSQADEPPASVGGRP